MDIKIPKQFYVGFNLNKGFLTPSDVIDVGFNKRKSTVDRWADGKTPSIFIENELLDGFVITKPIKREYYGGGNVVWCITDPRGFQFEISSKNLESILADCSIINGAIQAKCCYGRYNNSIALLPENSEIYQKAVNRTNQVNAGYADLDTLKVGDVVVNSKNEKSVFIGTYYGNGVDIKKRNGVIEQLKVVSDKVHLFRRIYYNQLFDTNYSMTKVYKTDEWVDLGEFYVSGDYNHYSYTNEKTNPVLVFKELDVLKAVDRSNAVETVDGSKYIKVHSAHRYYCISYRKWDGNKLSKEIYIDITPVKYYELLISINDSLYSIGNQF